MTALCAALTLSRGGYYDRRARPESRRRARRNHYRLSCAARSNLPPAANLLDRMRVQLIDATDCAWAGKINFVPTREGWLYLVVLLDLCSRRMVENRSGRANIDMYQPGRYR